jgi:DNA-binding transcriptional regulator YdaS (Cro superfamily)
MTLADYLANHGISAAELGRRLNISRAQIHRYLTGRRRITAERAVQIEHVTEGNVTRHELRPDLFGKADAA